MDFHLVKVARLHKDLLEVKPKSSNLKNDFVICYLGIFFKLIIYSN